MKHPAVTPRYGTIGTMLENRVSLRELRDNLGTVVREIGHTGQEVIITDHGKEIAAVVSMADYERLHEHADLADALWLRNARTTEFIPMSLADMMTALGVTLDDFAAGAAA